MTENKDAATSWLEGLAARGIGVVVRANGRLGWNPSRAYSLLTDEEVIFFRHNRAAIRECVRSGRVPSVQSAPPEAPSPAEPARCRYCYQGSDRCTRLQARDLSTWRLLHALEPAEAARRINEANARANAEMAASFRRQRDGDSNPIDFIGRDNTCDTNFEQPPAAFAARPTNQTRSVPPARRRRG